MPVYYSTGLIAGNGALIAAPSGVGGAGQVLSSGGDGTTTWVAGGNVTKVGTPTNSQIGVWTGDGTLGAYTGLQWNDGTQTLTVGDQVTSAVIQLYGNGVGRLHEIKAVTTGGIAFSSSGSGNHTYLNLAGFTARSGGMFGWTNNSGNANSGVVDLSVFRDAANILAQRNATNAQTLRLYASADGSPGSNYSRLGVAATTTVHTLSADVGGTFASDNVDIAFTPANSGRVRFGTHSGLASETVTGYITIKDAGGTERKLAVVS